MWSPSAARQLLCWAMQPSPGTLDVGLQSAFVATQPYVRGMSSQLQVQADNHLSCALKNTLTHAACCEQMNCMLCVCCGCRPVCACNCWTSCQLCSVSAPAT